MWMPASTRWPCPMARIRRAMARPRRPIGKAARNERRKALAATLNALSVAPIITAVIQPVAAHGRIEPNVIGLASIFFVAAQLGLHYILGRLED